MMQTWSQDSGAQFLGRMVSATLAPPPAGLGMSGVATR
jgi:hypothetical protein